MIAESIVWLTLFAPLASFLLIGFIVWPAAYLRSKSDESTLDATSAAEGNLESDSGESHDAPQRDSLGNSAGIITIVAVGDCFRRLSGSTVQYYRQPRPHRVSGP